MANKDLKLTTRRVDTRDSRVVEDPVRFSLDQIYGHFENGMSEVRSQFVIADRFNKSGDATTCKMIWRSLIVFAEGLLDFYIHEISKYGLVKMFNNNWKKSDQYAHFLIPMEKVEDAIALLKTSDWLFNYLNDRFSRDVYLSSECMKDQLNLIGIPFNQVMFKAFPSENKENSIKIGKEKIKDLFQRRNQIVHQNDRSHSTAIQNEISKEFVETYISDVEKIANAINAIAKENDLNCKMTQG